jgi:RNA polymerase sigma-70 factor (ECF subfamily)
MELPELAGLHGETFGRLRTPIGDGEVSVNARKLMEMVGPLDDAELVRRIRSGEPALFELVMRRYNQRLFRVLRALLRDDVEAEDVLQEAYVRAFAHLGQLERPERLVSWLTHIAVHEAKARLRRRGRVVDLKEAAVSAVRSEALDPEQEALGKQLQDVLASAIDALPVGYRTVFVLRDLEGLSTNEVAQSLRLSEQAVKMRLHRARAALRTGLYDRVGAAALPPFSFDGERCDRIVANVLARLQLGSP